MAALHLLRWFILLPALAPLVYYCLAIYSGLVYFRRLRKLAPPDRSFAPPVSILKPVRGLDHAAYENFASFCGLDYSDYEILFAVADPDDPIIPVIEKLQRNHPKQAIRLIVGVEQLGITLKTNSLVRLVQEANRFFGEHACCKNSRKSGLRSRLDHGYNEDAPRANWRVRIAGESSFG